jgi:hypothetical protein
VTSTAVDVTADAVAERAGGGQPGRLRSVLAAAAIGVGAAVIAYKFLRSGG